MAIYGSLTEANTYFSTQRLHIGDWPIASDNDKNRALAEATLRIDRLRFTGAKVDAAQELEFPRFLGDEPNGTEVIPDEIELACYEVALELINENLPEDLHRDLDVKTRAFSSVLTTFSRDVSATEHVAAGIPSFLAWQYLMPFLASSRSLRLRRVN